MKPKIFDNFADYHVFSCGCKGRVKRVGDISFMDNEERNELYSCLEFVVSKIERLYVKMQKKNGVGIVAIAIHIRTIGIPSISPSFV
jgi:hypothetical protein